MKPARELIEEIASDRRSGASQLAMKGLDAVDCALWSNQEASPEELLEEVLQVARILRRCRPSMAAIANCARRIILGLDSLRQRLPAAISREAWRMEIAAVIDQVRQEAIASRRESLANAAAVISRVGTVATCSYSSTVVEGITQAYERNHRPQVIVIRSLSGSLSHGEKTRQELQGHGIGCRLLEDDFEAEDLGGIDLVILGSDQLCRDGTIVNGYPSLRLAEAAVAHQPPIPVYAISDRFKLNLDFTPVEVESGFEVIPSRLLTGIITEDGTLAGPDIAVYAERHWPG